jgi:hypothetical protein
MVCLKVLWTFWLKCKYIYVNSNIYNNLIKINCHSMNKEWGDKDHLGPDHNKTC